MYLFRCYRFYCCCDSHFLWFLFSFLFLFFIIIIILIITPLEFFTSALADGFSQEFE